MKGGIRMLRFSSRIILAITFLICGSSAAFATEAQSGFHPTVQFPATTFPSFLVGTKKTVRLPKYAELMQLPAKVRTSYLRAFQAALIELDSEARQAQGENSASLLEVLLNEALADSGVDFCINLGVVKPLDQCDQSKGIGMHSFDTRPIVSVIGDAANNCQEGTKPCSPAFGFDASGNLLCSSANLTRDCDRLSHSPDNLPLADVLTTCNLGNPGKAKVGCSALEKFYDDQVTLVENHCQKSRPTFACGILRQQMALVGQEFDANKKSISSPEAGQLANLVQKANEAVGTSSSSSGETVPCQPTQPSVAHKSVTPAAQAVCQQLALDTNKNPDFESIAGSIGAALKATGKSPCVDISLPDQSVFTVDKRAGGEDPKIVISFPKANPAASPVELNENDLTIIDAISKGFQQAPYKRSGAQLLAAYLPKKLLPKNDSLILPGKNGAVKSYPSRGWTTADGTRIRYIPSTFQVDGKVLIAVGITLPNGQEKVVGVPVQDQ